MSSKSNSLGKYAILRRNIISRIDVAKRASFDATLRTVIADTVSLDDFFSNKVSESQFSSIFRQTLQQMESPDSPPFQGEFWNPTVSALLDTLSCDVSKIQLRPESSSVTDSKASVHEHVPSRRKKDKTPAPRVSNLVVPPTSKVHDEMRTHHTAQNASKKPLFQGSHCAAAACTRVGCTTCESLFVGLFPTPCVGHSNCLPSGWFPHVGEVLWHKLRRVHIACYAFNPSQTRAPRDREMLPLKAVVSVSTSAAEHPAASSSPGQPALTYSQVVADTRKRRASSHGSLKSKRTLTSDWCDDVEELDNTPEGSIISTATSVMAEMSDEQIFMRANAKGRVLDVDKLDRINAYRSSNM